jgi:CRP/FNR family transcriptional regulator, cyclic AMP receptor protein
MKERIIAKPLERQTLNLPKNLVLLGYGQQFRNEVQKMIESLPMFDQMEGEDLALASEYMLAYTAPPGVTIIVEGDRDAILWIVIEGTLEVRKQSSEGDERQLAIIRAGKTIGEMAFIDDQPHSASVTTTSDVTLVLLTRRHLIDLMKRNCRTGFKLLWKISELLSARLRQTSGRLIDLL